MIENNNNNNNNNRRIRRRRRSNNKPIDTIPSFRSSVETLQEGGGGGGGEGEKDEGRIDFQPHYTLHRHTIDRSINH